MTYTFKIKDKVFSVEIEQEKDQTVVKINEEGRPVEFEKIDDYIYSIIVDGKSLTIGVLKNGNNIQVFMDGDLFEIEAISERDQMKSSQVLSGVQEIKSPMPSRVVKILKEIGDEVDADEGIVVVEAMKMESELKSPIEGKVTDVLVNEGDAVEAGNTLLIVSSD
ncbi:MAG: acetyl-CoA carboxylase biotin carboxyl carrier protein subunit [Thermodesulfobacteriota bacterium]|nr:MAG: acetyl-CoA carboxylase biotin carboxyl carrier protein subunit [Thermodesulfobacteriota bacterium]